ncbi:replication factor C large subunit [Nanobdella aerobiophila]|uniref:Replication factor C large subunit n=1 Tax=Nanobdella aerobiophila TaxID=2586965 RepID=A0A915WRW5_9ARCH|nr:replication factor C large subunit [Nanobdella aerobiophila]BBL45684.1 replication factor C large subunit [Nanobdella aerobiophila]
MDVPWIKRYSPKHINEIINQSEAIGKIKDFIENYSNSNKRALLLYGPPGVGKTSSVYAIANDLNYEVIELNASDERNAGIIYKRLSESVKGKPFLKKGRIILIDEIDGISGFQDKGGILAILKICKESIWPVIFTANDAWDQRLRSIREISELVEFKKLSNTEIIRGLRRIIASEKINIDENALKLLVERSQGDLRSAINDLQTLSSMNKKISSEDIEALGYRERETNIFRALGQMFKASTIFSATMPFVDLDMDPKDIEPWIEENIPNEYDNIKDIYNAYDWLSIGTLFYNRIFERQYWELLKYATTIMYAGVALAKEKRYNKFTRYRMPNYIRKLSQNKEIRSKILELSKNLKKKVHSSNKRIRDIYINTLINLLEKDPEIGEEYAKKLGFEDSEISYIKQSIKKL